MLQIHTDEEMKRLYALDAEFIAIAFLISEEIGKISIKMILNGLKNSLCNHTDKEISSLEVYHEKYTLGLLDSIMNRLENDDQKLIVMNSFI